MKILAPSGNMESLKVAVYNGADEVYVGINQFNARNNIDGFTIESLKEAVDFAHIFGVKVNLALNILFDNSELKEAVALAVKAYNLGVDAFIIQDLGLITLLQKYYPEMEIHASTQMGIHNLEGVRFLEKLGIKRVVLSRETPLSEVKRIRQNSNIEIEYFVHGALCVSFSGNCYLSSYVHSASGNRGRCKQLCRLPYTLLFKGKKIKSGYLLSAKDFDMTLKLKDLKDAGVDVIKIEGRARRPFYVGTVVKAYKKALDGEDIDKNELKLAFNRGSGEGYFNGNGNIISENQNHFGIYVGDVERVSLGKRFNVVEFSSNRKISKKSSLKVFYGGKEISAVTVFDLKEDKSRYVFTTTQKIPVGSQLNLIVDAEKEDNLTNFSAKKDITLCIDAKINSEISVSCEINGESIFVFGDKLEEAKNSPLSKEEIEDNFSKNPYFKVNLLVNNLENVFIQKQKLNAFRRKVFDKIIEVLTKRERIKEKIVEFDEGLRINKFKDFQIVYSVNEKFTNKNIIYSPEEYSTVDILNFMEKCKKEYKIPYLDTPNFALEKDVKLLKNIVDNTGIIIVANNYYALEAFDNFVIGGGLNIYNNHSANYLNKPFFVSEGNVGETLAFPFMTLRHCPIKNHVGGDCKGCKFQDGFSYVSADKKEYKLKRKKLSTCTFYLV